MRNFIDLQNEINEVRENLDHGFIGDNFDSNILYDYNGSSAYISDTFSEIADGEVSIYTKDLFDNAYHLYIEGYTERAISEFGQTDMEGILISAEYIEYTEELYENEDNIILGYVLNYIEDNHIDLNITEDEFDYLIEVADDMDSSNRIYDIDEAIEDRITEILEDR